MDRTRQGWLRARRGVAAAALLVIGIGLTGGHTAGAAGTPVPGAVTLVGSLQSELGCPGDWDPACAATHLSPVTGRPGVFAADVTLAAGSYEYKVALDDAWTENYGAGGARDGANIPIAVAGPAALRFTYDHATNLISATPTDLPDGTVTAADRALATPSLRDGPTRENFYFLMTDRFENGSTANDLGGYPDAKTAGYDPTHKGYYHGGDLPGLISRLDYVKGLGTTAIWLTPSFKNKPVQDNNGFPSAGYHGYWITDFTQIDPHLGTNDDLKRLIATAHAKGMKVYFDIITNHTADVIDYTQKRYDYIAKKDAPYKDAAGNVFDDSVYAGTDTFPALDAATSFPYTPFVPAAEQDVKVPAWLNDVTNYHNRGNSTFAGESAFYGDFFGLDDLFTEKPEVRKGMTEIYKAWVDFGVDGFRIDTAKHVDTPFWQSFIPAIRAEAAKVGTKNFLAFGEVFDADPAFTSRYTTTAGLQATLDFPLQQRAQGFATGKKTTELRDVFQADDWYTDADSNVYSLPTFLGNHDMGRIAKFIEDGGATGGEVLQRDVLAHSLLYLSRGQPVVYYGDEQGFVGDGGDQDARQDMFPSKVASYNDDVLVGTTKTTADSNFDTGHPLYKAIAGLAKLRQQNPALADGTQVHRYASNAPGVYAFSRIDTKDRREYVVALNNSTAPATATFATYTPGGELKPIYGDGRKMETDAEGRVTVTVPALSAVVWKADDHIPRRRTAPGARWITPATPGATLSPAPASVNAAGRAELRVALPEDAYAQVSFGWRPAGTAAWSPLGTDDNAPYRVMPDLSRLARGTVVELRAVVRDISGNLSASSSFAVVGDPAAPTTGGGPTGPVVQPDAVSVPGDHNSEMGCPGDWQPDCPIAQLTRDPADDVWKGTYTVPAGAYAYKVAINRAWDENYGLGAARNGANIPYTSPGTPVTFYYDHATHWVTNTTQGPIVTAPGSFQSELGCAADWSPDCMRSWLEDPDGDGVFTFSTTRIPAGSYETKVAHGLSWTENYGQGGVRDGSNIAFNVPSTGSVTTFAYTLATHVLTVSSSRPGIVPDLTAPKAVWAAPDVIAWPAGELAPGTDLATTRFRLVSSATGGLAVDAEAVTGGRSAPLAYDPGGLPASVVAAAPAIFTDPSAWVALRVGCSVARQAGSLSAGQLALSVQDDTGALLDATGVQLAGTMLATPPPRPVSCRRDR